MQAVIMVAGRGTRMGKLVEVKPKPLLKINEESILEHTIYNLPDVVTEAIIVIGYLGEKIKKEIGNQIGNIKVKYLNQENLEGTADALWKAKSFLNDSKFLVLGGDDWFVKEDLEDLVRENLAIGVQVTSKPIRASVMVKRGNLFDGLEEGESRGNTYRGTGAYILDKKIFNYEPVRLKSGELGLPQTISNLATNKAVKVVEMPGWRQVNTPDDFEELRTLLKV